MWDSQHHTRSQRTRRRRVAFAVTSIVIGLVGCSDRSGANAADAAGSGDVAGAGGDTSPDDTGDGAISCNTRFDCPLPAAVLGANSAICPAGDRCVDGTCITYGVRDCSSLDSVTCIVSRCDADTYSCVPTPAPDGTPCQDGQPCTKDDRCKGGACVDVVPYACDDKDDSDCMLFACSPYDDTCLPVPIALGTPCRKGPIKPSCDNDGHCDGLVADTCFGVSGNNCDDGDGCTAESCSDAKGCASAPLAVGAACDDGVVCTNADACGAGGACAGGAFNEGKPCGDATGCVEQSVCEAGSCVGVPGNEGGLCDDGDRCSIGERCVSGSCTGAVAVACPDDHNPCTADVCVSGRGCVYRDIGQGEACDAGPCSKGGSCRFGWCVGTAAVGDGAACGVGSCAGAGSCVGGRCVGSADLAAADVGAVMACAPATPVVAIASDEKAGVVVVYDLSGRQLAGWPSPLGPLGGIAIDQRRGDRMLIAPSTGDAKVVELSWQGKVLGARAFSAPGARLHYYRATNGADRVVAHTFSTLDVYDAATDAVVHHARGKPFPKVPTGVVGVSWLNDDGTFAELVLLPGQVHQVHLPSGTVHLKADVPVVSAAGLARLPGSGLRVVAEAGDRRRVVVLSERGSYLSVIPLGVNPSDLDIGSATWSGL